MNTTCAEGERQNDEKRPWDRMAKHAMAIASAIPATLRANSRRSTIQTARLITVSA